MTREGFVANWQDANQARVKEIKGPYDLGCFQRYPRTKSHNIIDARWVLFRKMVEGNVGAKCRLIVRGFEDKLQDLDTCAANDQSFRPKVCQCSCCWE